MKKEFHIASSVIALIVALLEYFVVEDVRLANSIIVLAVVINSFVHLYSEFRFYRQNDAVIASSQFLLIPFMNIILINFLGPLSASSPIIQGSASVEISSTETSLLAIPYLVLTTFLMGRYYQKRYTGFVLKRKVHGPLKFPLFVHTMVIAILMGSTAILGYMDVIGLSATVIYIIQILSYLVIPKFRSSGYDNISRRRYMNRLSGGSSRGPSARSDYSPPTERRVIPQSPSQRSDRPKRGRSISTTPDGGYRTVPVESRNNTSRTTTQKNNRQRTTAKPTRKKVARVSDGIAVLSMPKPAIKGRNANFLPNGNTKKEDLKCMICYQDFDKSSKAVVSLCPDCKYPAHEAELHQWLIQSSKCPRCSRDIKNRVDDNMRIEEKGYVKMIKNL